MYRPGGAGGAGSGAHHQQPQPQYFGNSSVKVIGGGGYSSASSHSGGGPGGYGGGLGGAAGGGGGGGYGMGGNQFDGKRMRKAVVRRTVDYNASLIQHLESRVWQKPSRMSALVPPDRAYCRDLLPPIAWTQVPANVVMTKHVNTSLNKQRCPIFTAEWTPEGRRLVTGASSGEFTLWNGLTFNFETIMQAHEAPVRAMQWSHNDNWMVTGDHLGTIKYWQSNMNNVKMYQGHRDPIRGLSLSPSDTKFATVSDDRTVKVFDFVRCVEDRKMEGHVQDVKCVDWHPSKSLIVTGGKDNAVKLWDPRVNTSTDSGKSNSLATIYAHHMPVHSVKWNSNGNWFISASRDHHVKLFDIRLMKEMQIFRGHTNEVDSLAWHPIEEELFVSGGSDGSVIFWMVGVEDPIGVLKNAHDSNVWALSWHPLGHVLCSGSNDHTTKFWSRNRPGDKMEDKYNLNLLNGQEEEEEDHVSSYSASTFVPGLGTGSGASLGVSGSDVIPGMGTASSIPSSAASSSSSGSSGIFGAAPAAVKLPPAMPERGRVNRFGGNFGSANNLAPSAPPQQGSAFDGGARRQERPGLHQSQPSPSAAQQPMFQKHPQQGPRNGFPGQHPPPPNQFPQPYQQHPPFDRDRERFADARNRGRDRDHDRDREMERDRDRGRDRDRSRELEMRDRERQ